MVAPTVAQGLPNPSPVAGFTPGPETNQFGSWGAAVESGGIPGSNQGLQQSGIFNPGDFVAPQQGPAAPAPNVPSSYLAPIPPPTPIPVPAAAPAPSPTISNTYNYAPPAPPPPAPTAAPTYTPPGPGQNAAQIYQNLGYHQNADGTYSYGAADGGMIPTFDDGGRVEPTDTSGGVQRAISLAKQSFGIPEAPTSMARGGAIPSYDDGGDVLPNSGYGGGDTTQATSEPAPAAIPSDQPAQTAAPAQASPPADQGGLLQKAIGYFSGAGAMAQDAFEALKQRVLGDQAQSMTPTQQNMQVLTSAAEMGPEVATGAVQHLKAQYEPRRMQAARALEEGHTGVGAKEATNAMDFVPDAHEVSFIPHQNGQDVKVVIQDPEGKTSAVDMPVPTLSGLLKGINAGWDKLAESGAGSLFSGAPFGKAPEQENEPTLAGRAGEAIKKGAEALTQGSPEAQLQRKSSSDISNTEPTFAGKDKQPEIAAEDQPYGGLNPEDEGGGRGGGFGGDIPGAPKKEPPVKGVNVRQGSNAPIGKDKFGRTVEAMSEAEADRQFAAHQRARSDMVVPPGRDLSTPLEKLPRGHAGTPETLNTKQGRVDTRGTLQDLQQQRGAQNTRLDNANLPAGASMGDRLEGGARRVRNASEVPQGWNMLHAAEGPGAGWIAVPPGVKPPPEAKPDEPRQQGKGPHFTTVWNGTHARYYATGERLPYTDPDTGQRSSYEVPMHEVDFNKPQRGLPQPTTRGGIDRTHPTGTAQAQIRQREEHDLFSAYTARLKNGEQLEPDQLNWMKNHEARIRGAQQASPTQQQFKPPSGWMWSPSRQQYKDEQGTVYDQFGKPVGR